MKHWAWLAVCCAAVSTAQAQPLDGRSWWHEVQTLAADKFEGRETGSRGEMAAQRQLVSELMRAQVAPAGLQGYFQPVRLNTRRILEERSSITLQRGDDRIEIKLGDQAILSARVNLAPVMDAPLVFVGYGLRVPDAHHDDFANLDVRGKVVVVFAGSPAAMPSALAAHYQSAAERWRVLRDVGAIGMISIPNPAAMDIPWTRVSLNRLHPSMTLDGAEFDDAAGIGFAATWNPDAAQMLFDGTGHTFAEIAALGKERASLPTFDLPLRLHAVVQLATTPVESRNVVAVIPGRDPKLKGEYIVLSAHLDHLGIGEPINGDRIYNGAMDNASGSAMLLDLARALRKSHAPLRRSLLFVWVTGEEKGLLGSRYFATHPTVPRQSLIADINTDMFLPIVPLEYVTVYGLAESDLGDHAASVITKAGYQAQPDPEPLRNLFIRSDQYSFIRQGIPSLAMKVGCAAGSEQERTLKTWLTERYHAPSDDAQQPVDLRAAAGFEAIVRDLTREIANASERPAWKPDSFFRRYANPQ